MKNIWLTLFVAPLLIPLFTGCQKEGTLNCDYRIEAMMRRADTVDFLRYDSCVGYLFYADTLTYTFDSYETALNGKMVRYSDRREIGYDLSMQADPLDTLLYFASVTRTPATIVVCDTVSKLYAYRMITIAKGLYTMTVNLELTPYKITEESPAYRYGRWMVKK